jgi:Domain of unknown function (DUF1844)
MPKKDEQHSEPEFKVTDRRKFTMDGELRPDAEVAEEKPQAAAPAPQAAAPPAQAPPPQPAASAVGSSDRQPASPPAFPPVSAPAAAPPPQPDPESGPEGDFALDDAAYAQEMQSPFGRLVLSLTQSSMMQLGLVAMDPTQPIEPDLAGARDTIDMLGALEEKTKGNLSKSEAHMLSNTVGELRMAYVGVQRRYPPRR